MIWLYLLFLFEWSHFDVFQLRLILLMSKQKSHTSKDQLLRIGFELDNNNNHDFL